MEKAKKYQEMLKLLKKATQKKEKDKDMKKMNKGGMNDKDKKVVPLMPTGVIYKGKAKDYPGIKKIIKDKYKKTKGGKIEFGKLSVKAGIDNNPNPTAADRIAGAKMKQKPKKAALGMMMLKKAMENSDTARKRASVMGIPGFAASQKFKKKEGGEIKKGYGAARQSGMGLQDENLTPGKTMDYYKDLI